MEFVHEGLSLSISELNTENKVGITMMDIDNPNYGYYMDLEADDIKRLIDWLQGSLDEVNNPQT